VPAGGPVTEVAELTVAVNVTFCPTLDGLAEEANAVVVPEVFTVCLGDKAPVPLLKVLLPFADPSPV
jgi:hypothetical protein